MRLSQYFKMSFIALVLLTIGCKDEECMRPCLEEDRGPIVNLMADLRIEEWLAHDNDSVLVYVNDQGEEEIMFTEAINQEDRFRFEYIPCGECGDSTVLNIFYPFYEGVIKNDRFIRFKIRLGYGFEIMDNGVEYVYTKAEIVESEFGSPCKQEFILWSEPPMTDDQRDRLNKELYGLEKDDSFAFCKIEDSDMYIRTNCNGGLQDFVIGKKPILAAYSSPECFRFKEKRAK